MAMLLYEIYLNGDFSSSKQHLLVLFAQDQGDNIKYFKLFVFVQKVELISYFILYL